MTSLAALERCGFPSTAGKEGTWDTLVIFVALILAQRAGGMIPPEYTGSSIYVALGQELGPQGNDAS